MAVVLELSRPNCVKIRIHAYVVHWWVLPCCLGRYADTAGVGGVVESMPGTQTPLEFT